ncbi:ankyrin repeat-containing domain protein [Nemania diffusa]|nr:ankyrin repeat-containing domain protein [Nemania diffusa]
MELCPPLDSRSRRTAAQRPAKQRRYRHTPTEWESRRETIIQLYVRESKTADEVVEALRSDFSFSIGRRQLYKKLDEWAVRKNSKLNHEDTSASLGNGDVMLKVASLTPLVQLSGTSARLPTPAASRTVASQSSPSDFVQADGSPARDPSQRDSVALVANKFRAPGNLSDNVIFPLRLVGRSSFSNHCLTTASGTEPANLSSSYLPRAESQTGSQPSREVTLLPPSNPSGLCSDTALSLEQSLYQVIGLISGKIGHINHSSAFQLKKSLDTLLVLSQTIVEELESDVSGFQFHHDSLEEGLNMTKSLIASSTSVTLNTHTSVGVPHHILPSWVVWRRRWKTVRLGTTTLTVTEKTSRIFDYKFDRDTQAQTTDWHFGAKLVFKPQKLNNILQIQVQQYQAPFGSISLPPKIMANNIVSSDSILFQVAERGSVEELQRLFATGEASLRDCNENGASLLYYASSGWNAPVCEYLIQNGFDVDEVIFIDSDRGETTPLHLSLGQDNLETSKALLAAGADPTIQFTIGGRRTGVIDILGNNMGSPSRNPADYEIVRYLFDLSSHFGVVHYRINGYRPLLYNLCNAGNTPTWLPVAPEEWVEFFLNRGCRTDDRISIGTCLHMFFRSRIHRPSELGWQKALIRLVHCGADVYAVDDWGKSVSEMAYAKLVCHELNNYDLGSYRGDLWDSVLHACNYSIAEFRAICPRVARYTHDYTREDFEKLWEDRESSCPYWDDGTLLNPPQNRTVEGLYATNEMVLCTCTDERPTRWLNTDDTSTNCRNIRVDVEGSNF